jgi:hypothetical protein
MRNKTFWFATLCAFVFSVVQAKTLLANPATQEASELKKITYHKAGETQVAPEKKAPEAFKKQAPETEERVRGFFFRVGGGVQLPLGSTTQVQKSLSLYGEVGSIKESYKLAVSSAVELGFGSYFKIGGREIKAGIELGYYQFNYKGTLDLSLPHPFIPNSPRTVTSEENLKDKLYSFIIYGLYPVIGGEKFNLYLGPALGFASGKYLSLQDFSITDNSPYGNSDVTVTNKIHTEDSISGLMLGGQASLEYLITQNLSLNLDGRVIYLSPKVNNLAMNANFSQVQLVLGLGYNF